MPLPLPLPPLAALPPHPEFRDMVRYQATGLLVVFIALFLLWAMMELLGAVFRRRERTATENVSPVASTSSSAPAGRPITEPEDIPEHHLVVIAAAVHDAFGPRARVISVAPHDDRHNWAIEGRRDIFAGHKLRP